MRRRKSMIVCLAGSALVAWASTANSQTPPFGGEDSVAYAAKLWRALDEAKLVGDGAFMSTPYQGTHPHGAVLDTIDGILAVDGHTGDVIVKRNYVGENVTKEKVADEPQKWLGPVTVMFRRESGYDPENQDWFWAKYLPDGTLDENPAGMPLAGRVAKGKAQGCIACHRGAPGGDMVFNHDRY